MPQQGTESHLKVRENSPLIEVDLRLELPFELGLREHLEKGAGIPVRANLDRQEGRPHEDFLQEVGVEPDAEDCLQGLDVAVGESLVVVQEEPLVRPNWLSGPDEVGLRCAGKQTNLIRNNYWL